VVAGIAIYAVAANTVSQKVDLDYSFGAFSCLGSICKTKIGVLPVAWRRYGQYKDRFIWD
jgi:hypothetical protein